MLVFHQIPESHGIAYCTVAVLTLDYNYLQQ